MAIRSYQNSTPTLGERVFVDDSAVVIGDVEIGADSSVWPLTVIRGDMHRIRIGALEIGDTAVGIAVSGAHRDEAFAACRHVIEEVKRRVPIWKRERYADGSEEWVDPTGAGAAR